MGVKERRGLVRFEMGQAILDSARDIAAKEGWQAVTIRRVAEKIEYSPPAIYEYFESKEALLEEEAREAFRIFLADLIAARDAKTDPRERLRAMGDAYWNFVWKHPELYQVISGLGGVNLCGPGHEHPHSEGKQIFETFRDVLQANLPAGGRATDGIEGKVMVMWSLFHGFFALLMTGRIPMESRDRGGARGIQAVARLLIGWRAGPGLPALRC